MKLLFIQGGSRLKQSFNGDWYTDPNFTEEIWYRYLSLCDHLTILLRREKNIYDEDFARNHFSKIPNEKGITVVPLEDNTRPKWNVINLSMRNRNKRIIEEEISKVDKVIIRSVSFYTQMAWKTCMDLKKPFLLEVTGFIKEGMSAHSLLGKMVANSWEQAGKKIAKDARCAIYVTEDALQKRYPCKGKMLGCSDVQLEDIDEKVLSQRLNKIAKSKGDIIIGTAAFLDVKWKGQENVLRAIASLKMRGINNIKYQMIGMGQGLRLKEIAHKLGIDDQVQLLGAKTHEEVFSWLDSIDIYVQPSYQEGLCRAIVEAMSRACPVICSDVGGNYELIDKNYIFPCGDYEKLAQLIEQILPNMQSQADRNFERAKHYEKGNLDKQREAFLLEFANS